MSLDFDGTQTPLWLERNELQRKYDELIGLLFDYVNPAAISHEEAVLALKEVKEDAWKYKDLCE